MRYRITRDGMVFGPYTDAEVRRYLASGNILPGDLAQAEGTEEWLPVAELFPSAPAATTAAAYPGGLPALYPDPPDFPWWAVLILAIITWGFFAVIWDVVEASWLHRIERASKAIWLYLGWALLYLLRLPGTYHDVAHNVWGGPRYYHPHAFGVGLLSFALAIASRFVFRDELQRHFNTVEPLGLRLSSVLTLFFGGIYFQYHFNRINELKRSLRVSVPS